MSNKLIHEEFNCFGFFGFGNGVSMSRNKTMYCNGCPKKDACWQIHRGRVAEVFPELAKKIDQLTSKNDGNKAYKAFMDKMDGQDPNIAVMVGNMQDAMAIQAGKEPSDRGPLTLDYPFEEGAPDDVFES